MYVRDIIVKGRQFGENKEGQKRKDGEREKRGSVLEEPGRGGSLLDEIEWRSEEE